MNNYEQFDLVLIDANHQENECRNEFIAVKKPAKIGVFHDISNKDYPGVKIVWDEVKSLNEYDCREYIDQYQGMGPYMGIGMAIRKNR